MNQEELKQIDQQIGRTLRQLRIHHNLSQQELGNRVGVSFQQIQKYEKAMNRISCSRLYAIAEQLNAPPAYFFEGLQEEAQEEFLLTANRHFVNLAMQIESLSLETQMFVKQLIALLGKTKLDLN